MLTMTRRTSMLLLALALLSVCACSPPIRLCDATHGLTLERDYVVANEDSLAQIEQCRRITGKLVIDGYEGVLRLDELEAIEDGLEVVGNSRLDRLMIEAVGEIHGTVRIEGNQRLKSVAIGKVTAIYGGLVIQDNVRMEALVVGPLEEVAGDLTIARNPAMLTLRARHLARVKGDVTFTDLASLDAVSLPSLVEVGGIMKVAVAPRLRAFTLPAPGGEATLVVPELRFERLAEIKSVAVRARTKLRVLGNPGLDRLSLQLESDEVEVRGNRALAAIRLSESKLGNVQLVDNANLSEVTGGPVLRLDSLLMERHPGFSLMKLSGIEKIPAVTFKDGAGELRLPDTREIERLTITNHGMEHLHLIKLERFGVLSIHDAPKLFALSLPELRKVSKDVDIVNCDKLGQLGPWFLERTPNLRVADNEAITDVEIDAAAGGGVVVEENPVLTRLVLESPGDIEGGVRVANNQSLEYFSIDGVGQIKGDLVIEGNQVLSGFVFTGLAAIARDLTIQANPRLQELTARNFKKRLAKEVGGSITITDTMSMDRQRGAGRRL